MRTLIIGLAALAIAAPAVAGPKPAAQNEDYNRYYDNDGYYSGPTWQENGRTYCRRRDGTVGLVVGAAAGALIGRSIDRGRPCRPSAARPRRSS